MRTASSTRTGGAKCKLPEDVHHVEKWRLALEMIDELIGWGIDAAGGRSVTAPTATSPSSARASRTGSISYVLDVKGVTSAYARTSSPRQPPKPEGRGRPPGVRYREDPSSLKELALAAGKQATVTVTWREGTRGKMSSRFLALRVRPANIQLRRARAQDRRGTRRPLADLRVAPKARPSRPSTGSPTFPPTPTLDRTRQPREDALADRARLPRAQRRTRPRPLRRPHLPRLEPPRHARLGRARVPDPGATTAPANQGGSLTLFQLVRELQALLDCWHGTCATCRRELPPDHPLRAPP